MIDHLNKNARVTRRVGVSAQRVVTVVDVPETTFRAALTHPADTVTRVDDSPRENPPYTIQWRNGILGPSSNPQAGARLAIDAATYEVLAGPLTLYHGSRVVGYEVPVMPVSLLYPYESSMVQQDGAVVVPLLSFALWMAGDEHVNRGEYLNLDGEAPPEYASAFSRNRALIVDGDRYMITSSWVDATGPRVRFTARLSIRG